MISINEVFDPVLEEFFTRWESGELKFDDVVLYTELVDTFKLLYPNASVAKFRKALTLWSDTGRIRKHPRHPHKGEGRQTYSLAKYQGEVYFPPTRNGPNDQQLLTWSEEPERESRGQDEPYETIDNFRITEGSTPLDSVTYNTRRSTYWHTA